MSESATSRAANIIALDVGAKRIGVARASTIAKLPQALETIAVDGQEIKKIVGIIDQEQATTVVVGWPRNQAGLETKQTAEIEQFIQKLSQQTKAEIVRQDESLTSVQAENQLGSGASKAAVDARAAELILDDYLGTLA